MHITHMDPFVVVVLGHDKPRLNLNQKIAPNYTGKITGF